MNNIPIESKKNYTDEFILLGVLVMAKKYGYQLQRMQIMKILQKLKKLIQDNLQLEAYHKEFVKDRHGDFSPHVYSQLSGLKQANFIESAGEIPYEKFFPTRLGEEIFDSTKMGTSADNEKLTTIKDILGKLINLEGRKSSGKLREENHKRKFIYNRKEIGMDELPNGEITTPNLKNGDIFVFDTRLALDWSLYKKIAQRKKEEIIPEDEIPKTQDEIYKMLGL